VFAKTGLRNAATPEGMELEEAEIRDVENADDLWKKRIAQRQEGGTGNDPEPSSCCWRSPLAT
jgi:hypothetical protein